MRGVNASGNFVRLTVRLVDASEEEPPPADAEEEAEEQPEDEEQGHGAREEAQEEGQEDAPEEEKGGAPPPREPPTGATAVKEEPVDQSSLLGGPLPDITSILSGPGAREPTDRAASAPAIPDVAASINRKPIAKSIACQPGGRF